MRIVMRASSSYEYYDDIENAYVFLNQELIKKITRRFELFDDLLKEEPDALEMHFRCEDIECGFYSYLGFHHHENGFRLEKETETHYDDHGWCEIPESSEFKGDLARTSFDEVFGVATEYTYMVVGIRGVCWEAYSTTGIRVCSEILPRELIVRAH